MALQQRSRSYDPPRVVLVGPNGRTDAAGDTLARALGRDLTVDLVEGSSLLRDGARAYSRAAACIRAGAEAAHLLDARFALVGALLQRRYQVPVTVDARAADVTRRLAPLGRLDHAFVAHAEVADGLRRKARTLPLSHVPPVATVPVEPTERELDRTSRVLREATLGQLVVAMPWPDDREHVRWYRDAIAPLLRGNPLTLMLDVPNRRAARLLTNAVGTSMRARRGKLTPSALAAAARCADVFVVPGLPRTPATTSELLLALASTGVPVVAGGAVLNGTLEHERNALVVEQGDAFGLVSTINQLLELPAQQRHALGEEFAAYTMARAAWADIVPAYVERFSALVGRPLIPENLRAA